MRNLIAARAGPYILLALTCALGWAFKAHCGASWTASIQYTTGCYSDAVPFWGLRGVAAGQVPYLQARMEYPVLTGALIWIEGFVARTIGGENADALDFLSVVAAVNAALAFVVLWMFERAGVDRARLYAWAGAPALVLYLGHNWDMLAVAFAVAALLAAKRDQAVRATALAALGAAAKLFPVLMLPLLGLGALFRRGGVICAATLVSVAIVAWGAVNLPIALAAFENWREFYVFSQGRSGTAASVWEIMGVRSWWITDVPTRNFWSFAIFAGGAAAIVAGGWLRHGARPWLLFTPVLAWFLLTNKVYSPQFDLWLFPFLLLTSRRLWPVAWFAIGDIAAYFAEFWMFAGMEGAWPAATPAHIAIAAAFRGAAMLWITGSAMFESAPDWLTPPPATVPPRQDRPIPAD
ncbi:hypothetical protein M0208_13465 [Sphingomonas sp. SUN019]|uniref:hypothetical protein n=1 Tax=Sphingomonas sp. SUN019 TaxID=2937788 RepID=UPI00216432E4|nr:hypothetical protein [Sphingomonas sp. SUN019]UVO51462.1 hypothetical protein M0208_13465 [Sphingomonas sp. SUN019]